MFGKSVWPDDFYSMSRGQRVHLSWPVPECSPGCPSGWVMDGHCDLSCNNSACEFDGGDCANYTGPNYSSNSWWSPYSARQKATTQDYCTKQCPDAWIGDKFCDKSCKVPECAMDAGDCDFKLIYQEVEGYNIDSEVANFTLLSNLPSLYFNLSSSLPKGYVISNANHDNNKKIRTAVISQRHKVIILTLYKNKEPTHVSLVVEAKNNENKNISVALKLSFEINNTLNINDTINKSNVTFTRNLKEIIDDDLIIEDYNLRNDIGEELKHFSHRKLMDNYSNSLRYADKLLSKKYGSEPRKVPAHMPLFFDKEIIEEMQNEWPEQFDQTSATPLRSSHDMQFAFVYNYYLMSTKIPFDFDEVWKTEIDVNGDGFLSETELRSLIARFNGGNLEGDIYDDYKDFTFYKCNGRVPQNNFENTTKTQQINSTIHNITIQTRTLSSTSRFSKPLAKQKPLNVLLQEANEKQAKLEITNKNNTLVDNEKQEKKKKLEESWSKVKLTKVYVKTCQKAYDQIKYFFSLRRKYKFEIVDVDQVGFVMVGNKPENLKKTLDNFRSNRPKFLCLNDDMNHSHPNISQISELLQDFYRSIVPLPSSFELPKERVNRYLYAQDLNNVKEEVNSTKSTYGMIAAVIILCMIFLLFGAIPKRSNVWTREHSGGV